MAAAKKLFAPAVFVCGLGVACAGVSLIYLPAGLIAAGSLAAALTVIWNRGATPDA